MPDGPYAKKALKKGMVAPKTKQQATAMQQSSLHKRVGAQPGTAPAPPSVVVRLRYPTHGHNQHLADYHAKMLEASTYGGKR